MRNYWFIPLMVVLAVACRYEPPRYGSGPPAAAFDAPCPGTDSETFYFGDGLGVNCVLKLTPSGRFCFTWVGCLGEYGRNHGRYILEGNELVLEPVEPNPQGLGGMATSFVVVMWADRKYLIPTERLLDFCNDVNAGVEPRTGPHGMHFLREGDLAKEAHGQPRVPSGWQAFLLDDPVVAVVTQVDPDTKTCLLDAGAATGLLPGMNLIGSTPTALISLEIMETSEYSSVARPEFGEAPSVGDQFRTDWYSFGRGAPN